MDVPSLSLPDNQDALIEQVAAANPHTIVVLETGTAVTMPWIDKVAGVVEAWYAGSSGHKALANVLVGDVNPAGKLPLSFPKSEADLPHPDAPKIPSESQVRAGDVADNGAPSANASAHAVTPSTTMRGLRLATSGMRYSTSSHCFPSASVCLTPPTHTPASASIQLRKLCVSQLRTQESERGPRLLRSTGGFRKVQTSPSSGLSGGSE